MLFLKNFMKIELTKEEIKDVIYVLNNLADPELKNRLGWYLRILELIKMLENKLDDQP